MEKSKNIIIIVLVAIIIFLRTCDSINPKCPEYTKIDTVLVEKWDTIKSSPKIIYLKPKNLTPVASYTINGTLPSFDSICSLKRIYKDSIADSNLTFFYEIQTIGILDKFEPSYKLKIPYSITHTIDKTITLTPDSRVGIYAGLELGGNKSMFNMTPFITLIDKKDNYYTLNYSLTQKAVNVGFGFKINKKRK